MNEMIDRIQSLGRKAAQLKQAVESVPGRVAEMRQAVALSAAQLQQLRSDVQVNVAGLRAPDGQRMVALLTEIVGQAEPIREAGYEIAGVEIEVDPVQRAFLLLDKVDDVSAARLQSLVAAQVTRPSLHGLLVALIKAEDLADSLVLPGLDYWRLRVEVGPVPTIRLCWQAGTPATVAPVSLAAASAPSPTPAIASMFGEGSFFERRPPVLTAPTSAAAGPPVVASLSTASIPLAPPVQSHDETVSSGGVRPSALDRFKKMPDLGKRSH